MPFKTSDNSVAAVVVERMWPGKTGECADEWCEPNKMIELWFYFVYFTSSSNKHAHSVASEKRNRRSEVTLQNAGGGVEAFIRCSASALSIVFQLVP